MTCVLQSQDPLALAKNMMSYFKQTQPDCILYSQDDCKILIHKGKIFLEPRKEMNFQIIDILIIDFEILEIFAE